MPLEFRVRWQREGKHPKTLIYQSWDSACRKVSRIAAVEQVKGDFDVYGDMPDLVGPPVLEVREVGAWRDHDYQPRASEYDVTEARSWAEIREREYLHKKGLPVPEWEPF